MKDYFLKFASKAEADSVLYEGTEVPVFAPGTINQIGSKSAFVPRYANIDTIGVISRPTGDLDADDNPVTAPIDGWHVNVRVVDGEDDAALLPYAVTPTQPMRVWW